MKLKLRNTTSHKEYLFDVEDLGDSQIYYHFQMTFDDIPTGEYEYTLIDGDTEASYGLMQVETYNHTTTKYKSAPVVYKQYSKNNYVIVDDITEYTGNSKEVYDLKTSKWYMRNNLDEYEPYGVYGEGFDITTYKGKITIVDGKEYEWTGKEWKEVGSVIITPKNIYSTQWNTYVDLNIPTNETLVFKIKGDFNNVYDGGWLLKQLPEPGARNIVDVYYDNELNDNNFELELNRVRLETGNGEWDKSNARVDIECGNMYIKGYLDDIKVDVSTTKCEPFVCDAPLYLWPGTIKIENAQIFINDTLVFDGVPDVNGIKDNVTGNVFTFPNLKYDIEKIEYSYTYKDKKDPE